MTFQSETYVEERIHYFFLWHSMGDACVKCLNLNGQEFEGQDLFQDVLWSPIWGDILDLNTGVLLTHPNCRCQCEVRSEVNIQEIDDLNEFQRFLEMMI